MFPRERTTVDLASNTVTELKCFKTYTTSATVCGLQLATESNKNDQTPSKVRFVGDTVTSGFRKAIAAGAIINNPFRSHTLTETYPRLVSYNHDYCGKGTVLCASGQTIAQEFRHTGRLAPYCEYLDDTAIRQTIETVKGLAVTQAHANVDVSALLALATVAEGRKTVSSMASILTRVVRIVKAAKRLDAKYLANELSPKEVADRYMELRYAIRPLIYDVRGVVKAVETDKSAPRTDMRQTFRGYAADLKQQKDTKLRDIAWLCQGTWDRKIDLSVSARAGVLCSVDIEQYNTWGLDQPLETMWELMPFSFIVDWFINAGDVISSWTPNAGVSQKASWVTVKHRLTNTCKLVSARSTASENANYLSGTASVGPAELVREELVLERFVNPPLNVVPSVKLRMDWFKITDLVIILKNLR